MNKSIKEGAPEARIQSILREVWTPALARTEPLRKDLNFYYDNDASKFEEPIMKEQIEFVQHIQKQIREKPYLALAYGHTMYLALFAGGRILRSNIMRAAGLFPQVEGLNRRGCPPGSTCFSSRSRMKMRYAWASNPI